VRRLLFALALAGVAALGSAAPALGHAQLVQSTPAAGEVLPQPPDELRLTFSEPIEDGYTSADLIGGDGEVLLERAGQPDPADRYTLVVAVPPLADGAYTVLWRTLSAADGHTAQGFLIFGVGEVELPVGIAGSQGESRGALHPGQSAIIVAVDDVGRTATYGGLMLAFGMAVVGLVVLRPVFGTLPGWALLVQVLGLAAAATGAAITIVVNAASVGATRGGTFDPLGYVGDSRTGPLLAGRLLLAAVAALLVLSLRRGRPLAALNLAGAAGLAGIVLAVLAGHAAGYEAVAPIAAAVVHVLAAGVWVSGLVALSFVALGRTDRVASLRACVPRFSALALASIGLVTVTGAYNAWLSTREVVSLGTPYQLNLALKVVLVGVALAIGGWNYLDRGRSAGDRWGIGRRVLGEAAIAALVVVATANLTAGSPPAEGRPVAIAPAAGTVLGGPVRLALTPGAPGVNAVSVDLTDAPPEDATVELVLQRLDQAIGTTRLPLIAVDEFGNPVAGHGEHGGHGGTGEGGPARHIANGAQLPDGSRWDASVVVTGADGTELARRRFTFAMGPDGVAEGRELPPLDPVLALAALLLGAGVLALAFRLGGGRLPLTNEAASRVALVGGAVVSLLLGLALLVAGPAL
jgi:methionine-rich copper-binding protein CopC/putative copper export protein